MILNTKDEKIMLFKKKETFMFSIEKNLKISILFQLSAAILGLINKNNLYIYLLFHRYSLINFLKINNFINSN